MPRRRRRRWRSDNFRTRLWPGGRWGGPALRATVTPLARLSPTGKFRVEVVGLATGSARARCSPVVCSVTVRLPVTATAPGGTPPRPPTWKVRGCRPRTGRSGHSRTGVEHAGGGQRDVGRAGRIREEVAGHVEHQVGGRAAHRAVGGAQLPFRAEGHRHPVGPVVADREVQGRGRRVGDLVRPERDVAQVSAR